MPAKYEYHQPRTLEDAWRLLAEQPAARLIAGGTDLLVHLRKRVCPPPAALVSLRSIPELAEIQAGRTLRIGAMASVARLAAGPEIGAALPALAQAAQWLGSAQIRNVATIGGNIANASPAADLVPPLLVYEARAELRSAASRREVPLADFFRGPGETCLRPGEILTAVLVERPAPGARSGYLRKGRVRMDLALAGVAALVEQASGICSRARLAACAVARTPLRLRRAEAVLEGARLTPEAIEQAAAAAAAEVSPIDDVRTSAQYRRVLVQVLLRRLLS
ncbi:MAG: xanthine dehydrogenase family protein subunit M [Planctomycetes bacterium]|nr:xanthine dehydrogenase family protein subunit M [Planctomycetota bacterium]